MLRLVPPAGAPLEMSQILRAAKTLAFSNGHIDGCLDTLRSRLQVRHVFGTSSGRAALWLILRALRSLRPDRCVVALPAYTCFTVPASVVRAGLKLRPIDIEPETLDFDFSELEAVAKEQLLCIVTSNLFGLVNDLERIQQIARTKGAFVVDDAAQALGASLNGHFSGTFGDVGLYSFGRGKSVAAVEGGVVVTNSAAIAQALEMEATRLRAPSLAHNGWLLVQMLAYAIFLNPRLYWLPNAFPFLKLGVTEFASGFPIASMPGLSRALLGQLLDEFLEINRTRRNNATVIAEVVVGTSKFTAPRPRSGCQPTYIRFPVIAPDEDTRDRAVSVLRSAGIGATSFYPSAICDISGIESHMALRDFHRLKAEIFSKRLFTLPTHHFVDQQDLERIAEVLTGL